MVIKNPFAFYSALIALAFMVLTFTVHWMFIIGAAVFSWLGWKELLR